MRKKITVKALNEKLLTIETVCSDNNIVLVKMTGDFFLYPEESLLILENALIGLPYNEQVIREKLRETIRIHHIRLFGISENSILSAIMYEG